jgi:hypothetical protein
MTIPDLSKHQDYTDYDWDLIKERIDRLLSVLFPDWTDYNRASGANLLTGSFAFLADIFAYYLNMRSRQTRLVTATERMSVIQLLSLINYYMSAAKAAKTDVRISLDPLLSIANDVIIPQGTQITTSDPNGPVFYTTVAATISAGSTSTTVEAENAEPVTDQFSSDGKANQRYGLTSTPYVQDSSVVSADNGAYDLVTTFVNSQASDRHVVVLVDDDDKGFLQFGDGVNGQIPVGTIDNDYKIGGGGTGNIDENELNIIVGSFTDILSNPVSLSVINQDAAEGGLDRETIAHAKEAGPVSIRSLNRTVCDDDFRTHSREVAGVADAMIHTKNQDVSIPENTGNLYVVAIGDQTSNKYYKAATPSTTLLNSVREYLTGPPPDNKPIWLTFDLRVLQATLLSVDITIGVFLEAGTIEADWKVLALNALDDYFAPLLPDMSRNDKIDFGGRITNFLGENKPEVIWSDVFNLVRDIDGTRKLEPTSLVLNGGVASLQIQSNEFPVLGTVTLINADTLSVF